MSSNYKIKDFEGSSHHIIRGILAHLRADSILDVGCAAGFLAKNLGYKPQNLIGIDKAKLPLAKGYKSLYQLDIEKDKLPFKQKFEAVVLGDVLEHLNNPAKTLKLLKDYLRADGSLIVSVPNGGFWLLRLTSFFKIKPQMEWGIFDKTHTRLFKIDELNRLLSKSGFVIEDTFFTLVPLELDYALYSWQKFFLKFFYLSNLFYKKLPRHFAYQIIVRASLRRH